MPEHHAPKEGTDVMFRDLVGRSHLNGRTGTVVAHFDGSLEDLTHRCRVRVHGTPHTVKVLPGNIVPVEDDRRLRVLHNRLMSTSMPAAEQAQLSTSIALNSDPILPKQPTPASTAHQRFMDTVAKRDPGRLRHIGLSFFRDSTEEEAHPASSRTRNVRVADLSKHTVKQGYDWRTRKDPKYRDPSTIPVEQGGHAAHLDAGHAIKKDESESGVPMHPRLRGLMMDEEQPAEELHETLDYSHLCMYGGEPSPLKGGKGQVIPASPHFAPIKPKAKAKAKAKRPQDAKAKRPQDHAEKLFQQPAHLSVKPPDDRILPSQHVQWSRNTDGSQVALTDAAVTDNITLQLLGWPPPKVRHWEAGVREDPKHVHQAGRGGSPELPSVTKEAPKRPQWQPPDYVSNRLAPGAVVEVQPANPEKLSMSTLTFSNPSSYFEESRIKEMLQASVQLAEKGFDYGPGEAEHQGTAGGRTPFVPWYDSAEGASSILMKDVHFASIEAQAGDPWITGSLMESSATLSEVEWADISAAISAGGGGSIYSGEQEAHWADISVAGNGRSICSGEQGGHWADISAAGSAKGIYSSEQRADWADISAAAAAAGGKRDPI